MMPWAGCPSGLSETRGSLPFRITAFSCRRRHAAHDRRGTGTWAGNRYGRRSCFRTRIARNPQSLRKHVWRAGRDHSADGRVEADGPALAGPLPRPGCRRASPGRHAPSGEEADPRWPRRCRRPRRMPGTGRCGRGSRGWSARHPEAERPRAAPGRDLQGIPRSGVRDQGPRCRHRQGRRPDGRPAPLAGVPCLPRPCRRGDRTRNPGACHPRHRLVAQVRTWPKGRPDRTFRWSRKPEDLVEACKGGHRRLREMAPDA